MVWLLAKVKGNGGWKLDHPAIRDKPKWVWLLSRMLDFNAKQRIGFDEIKQYLNKLTPSANKPISRTMT